MLPSVIVGLLIGPPTAPATAPRALMSALVSIEVTQGDGGKRGQYQQGFQMVFSAERGSSAAADYPLLTNTLLKAGQRVIITVTIKSTPRVLFDGIITHQGLEGVDEPIITVTGQDLTALMGLVQAGKRRPGQGDKDAALDIIGKYSSYGIKPQADSPENSSPATENQRVPIQIHSDLEHLRALAAANGFVFYLKPGPSEKQIQACWGKKPRSANEQTALSTRLGTGTNVASIHFSSNSLSPTQVVGAYADPDKTEPSLIEALIRSGGVDLSKIPALKANNPFTRKIRLFDTPFNAADSLARAQAIVNRSAESAIKVNGTLDTARYGDLLFAPGRVGVRGAGETYDGEYDVDSVTHKITPDSYTQEFHLSREGTGSKTSTVKGS